jgi:hypothetical protein
MSPAWLSAEQGAFRSALAEQIIADVGAPDASASAEQVLSGALVQAVVPSAAAAAAPSADPDTAPLDAALAAQRAAVLSDVLANAELVTIDRTEPSASDTDQELAADVEPDPTLAVILVGDIDDPVERAVGARQWVHLGAAFAQAGLSVVLVTGSPQSDDVGVVVAADRSAAGGASIVADAWTTVGPLIVVLAAQEQVAGGAGSYGSTERGSLLPTS